MQQIFPMPFQSNVTSVIHSRYWKSQRPRIRACTRGRGINPRASQPSPRGRRGERGGLASGIPPQGSTALPEHLNTGNRQSSQIRTTIITRSRRITQLLSSKKKKKINPGTAPNPCSPPSFSFRPPAPSPGKNQNPRRQRDGKPRLQVCCQSLHPTPALPQGFCHAPCELIKKWTQSGLESFRRGGLPAKSRSEPPTWGSGSGKAGCHPKSFKRGWGDALVPRG